VSDVRSTTVVPTTEEFRASGGTPLVVNTATAKGYVLKDPNTVSQINAGTATSLETARTINGVSFDGTANITITATPTDGTVTASKLASSALGFSMVNGTFVPSNNGTALTIAIKTFAGADPSSSDPVLILFRNVTAATGDFTVITLTAATSFTVSSGSTLGTVNGQPFRIWIVGFNDGGTFRLGFINCLTGSDAVGWNIYPLSGWGIASSTAEGGAGAADSAHVFYTGTAVTSKPYVILGWFSYESGLSTAGTWNANPTRIHLQTANDPVPGSVIQRKESMTGAVATGTTTVPFDDTIPQNTEGTEYMSVSIIPTSAANLLHATSQGNFASSNGAFGFVMALFRDSTADALAVSVDSDGAVTGVMMGTINLSKKLIAASVSSTTLKIRAGSDVAGTTTFNGIVSTRRYGGVVNSFVAAEEIMT
jgi:hypothetical protein